MPQSMTYEKFLETVRGEPLDLCIHTDKEGRCFLEKQWVVDGERGGSCWDTEETRRLSPVDPEPEPDPGEMGLDKILEAVCPEIPYLKYRKITEDRAVVETRSVPMEREYYGNWTQYKAKSIHLRQLYEKLVELGYIQ